MTAPDFNCKFRTEYFDLGFQQGLAAYLRNGKRFAVRIREKDSPMVTAAALRALAKWIEDNHTP